MKEYFIKLGEKLKFYSDISRSMSLLQTVIPYALAVIFAAKNYQINYPLSLLGLIGIVPAHLGANLLDDYLDWRKGIVREHKKLIDSWICPQTHRCFYFKDNLITPESVLKITSLMFALSGLILLYTAVSAGFMVLLIAGLAAFLGFSYSVLPLKLSEKGFGEITVGLIFGPLLMSEAYVIAGGNIDFLIILTSFMIGLLIVNILHTQSIMEFEPDMDDRKMTLAVSLKTQNNAFLVQILILATVYLTLSIGVVTGVYPFLTLLTFITLPKAVGLIRMMESNQIDKRRWMGLMENWGHYQEEGLDWFMLRWFVSRNLLIEVVVILGLTYILG